MLYLDRTRLFVLLLTSASTLKLVDTKIIVSPEDVEAALGTSVVFNCSSSIPGDSIQWNIHPYGKSMGVLYAFGKVNTQYGDRFTVQNGQNLYISSVTMYDAGTYECQDDFGQGQKHGAELILIVTNPICQSNRNFNKVVGNNSWGIEPGQVTLSCIVQFQGNKPPTLEWKENGEDKAITSSISSEIRGNWIWHNLTIKGDTIENGSSFNCRPAKATSIGASCNSSTITIIDESSPFCHCESCQINIAAIICICLIAVAITGLLSFGGWYILKKYAKRKEKEDEKKKLQENLKDLESHLFSAETIEYPKDSLPLGEIETHTEKSIKGLTVLEATVFVLFESCSDIEVYNAETYRSEPQILIPEIIEPFDMTGLKDENSNKCLFIVGNTETTETRYGNTKEDSLLSRKSEIDQGVIVRMDVEGNLLKQWSVKSGGRNCHLSTYKSNLVVLLSGANLIMEFSRDGDLKCTVDLTPCHITSKLHAIKITNMHFAVSSIDADSDTSAILVIDLEAIIKKEYKTRGGGIPCHFVVDGGGSYLVADKNNRCISLFSSTLKFCRNLIEIKDGTKPVRICFDEERNRLFVAADKFQRNKSSTALVKIYNMKSTG